jgi:EpsI family protein
MTKLAVAFAFLALNFYTYNFMAREMVGDWRCGMNEPLDADILENLGAADTLLCDFEVPDEDLLVHLYIGYHETQVREEGGGAAGGSIHPPAHCLPGSGWDIIDSRDVPLPVATSSDPDGRAKRLVIAKGEARQLVYYWYQMHGRAISEDWKKIILVGYNRATAGRTDGALVRFTTFIENDGDDAADARLIDLASRVVPLLSAYVPD